MDVLSEGAIQSSASSRQSFSRSCSEWLHHIGLHAFMVRVGDFMCRFTVLRIEDCAGSGGGGVGEGSGGSVTQYTTHTAKPQERLPGRPLRIEKEAEQKAPAEPRTLLHWLWTASVL